MSAVTVAPNGLINYRFGSDPNDIFDEAKQLAGDLNGEHPFVLSTEQEGRDKLQSLLDSGVEIDRDAKRIITEAIAEGVDVSTPS